MGLQNKFPYNSIRMITAEKNEMGGAYSAYDEMINVYRVLVWRSLSFFGRHLRSEIIVKVSPVLNVVLPCLSCVTFLNKFM